MHYSVKTTSTVSMLRWETEMWIKYYNDYDHDAVKNGWCMYTWTTNVSYTIMHTIHYNDKDCQNIRKGHVNKIPHWWCW